MLVHSINRLIHRVPASFRSRYALVIYVFLSWMLFFDAFNAVERWQLFSDLQSARQQYRYYEAEIAVIRNDLDELFTDASSLEKFAREKYFMKRPDEDLFVIIIE